MSAPKFTPGPWSLEAGRSIVTPSGRFYLGYGSHPKSGNPEFRNFVELDNNAHLCAAAPELYEALRSLIEILDASDLRALKRAPDGEAATCALIPQARNALGKAGGA